MKPRQIAKAIRNARGRQDQRSFARRFGVSQQTVSDWEHGLNLRPVITGLKLALVVKL